LADASYQQTGLKILEATVAVRSNRRSLLPRLPPPIEVKSLLTDFRAVEEIPYSSRADGFISVIENSRRAPAYRFTPTRFTFEGPLARLSRRASDLRFSLWGNQGFLYRFTLLLLELKHRIFNLHACALYQPEKKRLYVVAGGAGSGKTVYLLSGLKHGLKLFTTETAHFRMAGGHVSWFMGSLVDNVRLGTLRHDFPDFLLSSPAAAGRDDEWQQKIALDLRGYRGFEETITDPEVIILFPRVEEGKTELRLRPLSDTRVIAKTLFDNITQKLTETVILYDCLPVLGLDRPELAATRLQTVEGLARHKNTVFCAEATSGPRECWAGLLERDFRQGG
jgi:hypothetical protein